MTLAYAAPQNERSEDLPQLRLKLLGSPEVVLDGTPVQFKRRKAVALLAYLAMTGRLHSRAALASLLAAGDADDAQAKTQLRNTLYALGPRLGAYLRQTRETIALDPAQPVWVDALELQRAVLAASTAGVAGTALAQAVERCDGALLAGLTVHDAPEFAAWLQHERRRLQDLLVQALTLLLAQAEEQGDAAATRAWAARLLAVEPGQEEAHRALMRAQAASGEHVAALAQYATFRDVLAPRQRTPEALHQELRVAGGAPPHNLTLPVPACYGRADTLAVLHARLAEPACRVLTLVGLGGSGKTSLALAAAAAYVEPDGPVIWGSSHPFPDGIFVVDLSTLSREGAPGEDAAQVMGQRLAVAIGQAVGLAFANVLDPLPAVARWLAGKRLLLVLDSAEGLADGALVVHRLVRQAPSLTVLTTARERLQLPEEWVLDVEGLALPREPAEVEQAPASRLILEQAQQVGSGGPLTDEERAAIVHICQLTGGLPLALILAARWRHTLSWRAIAEGLERGLDLLTTPESVVPERQRSMRGVLAATWERLAPQEQAALRHLAVFRGGCTLEGAQAVAEVATSTLLALRDCALLAQGADGRYRLHEWVRQYAGEQAAMQPAEASAAAERHARYYAALVERAHADSWRTSGAALAIGAEVANAEAAWAWAAAHGAWHLLAQMSAGLLAWYWASGLLPDWVAQLERAGAQVRQAVALGAAPALQGHRLLGTLLVEEGMMRIMSGQFEAGHQALDRAAAIAGELPAPMAQELQGRIAFWRGTGALLQRDLPTAQRESEQALALGRALHARDLEATSLLQLGRLAVERNDAATANAYLEQARTLLQALGNRSAAAEATLWLARSAFEQGRSDEAQRCLEAALHVAGTLHNTGILPFIQVEAGRIYEGQGRHREAELYFTQALAGFQALGYRHFDESYVLACLGRSALAQGDQSRARRLYEQALHTGHGPSAVKGHTWALLGLGRLAHDRGDEREAQTLAEQARSLAQRSWQCRAERFAQHLLGEALAGQGRLEQARVAYHVALQIDQTLGYPHLAVACRAGLARAAMAAGDLAQATAEVRAVLEYLDTRALDLTEEPIALYLACHEVLQVAADPRAQEVLAAGHALLRERAAQFEDAEQRRMFLECVPAHRRIDALWQEHERPRQGAAAS